MNKALSSLNILEAAKKIYFKAKDDHASVHASALAFSSVLSLIPLMALAYFFFDAFGGLTSLETKMQGFIVDNIAPSFGDKLQGYVTQVRSQISSGAMGIFGLMGFIFTSFSMLFKMEYSINFIFGIRKMRPLMQRVMGHWTIMTLSPIILAASISLTTYVVGWLQHDNGEIAKGLVFLFTLMPYMMMAFLLTAVYLILPATRVNRRAAIVGGTIAGFAFELAKHAYAEYASRTLGKSVYGSLAVFPVFLVWIQFVWTIILYGGQITFYLHNLWCAPESRGTGVE